MLQQQYAQVENEELQEAVGESASEVKRLLAVRYFRILTCAADSPKHRMRLSALARQSNPIRSNPGNASRHRWVRRNANAARGTANRSY